MSRLRSFSYKYPCERHEAVPSQWVESHGRLTSVALAGIESKIRKLWISNPGENNGVHSTFFPSNAWKFTDIKEESVENITERGVKISKKNGASIFKQEPLINNIRDESMFYFLN